MRLVLRGIVAFWLDLTFGFAFCFGVLTSCELLEDIPLGDLLDAVVVGFVLGVFRGEGGVLAVGRKMIVVISPLATAAKSCPRI